MTTEEQTNASRSMSLSALAYIDFSGINPGTSLGTLISNHTITLQDMAKPELSFLNDANSPLRAWKLIAFQPNTASGFAAVAFQAPPGPNGTPGQIVFAFRGTEPVNNTVVDGVPNIVFWFCKMRTRRRYKR